MRESELTPFDLSPNYFALAYCILVRDNPERVLDRALAKFELKDSALSDTGQKQEDPATTILSIINKRRKS
jgi:hypothetical protein